jgi:hypothetical protein
MEGKNRYRELENNWIIDIKSFKALEIVLVSHQKVQKSQALRIKE